ncbi:hypothetical protein GGTG_09037 [Gaeumannomyces tritici R3-111a-1]|uniref:Uncharacterized protein n=1 Tax=Gaeumannomyces tritici (strain R3-111a-1) TaxID=644352 RepID=J3P696_GAET3|nr:hypothetical protein GGTG_09037 [Gaeumannomyces tritici R3-111a-1]EJT72170.1 hypothetical protein GGTG_09037 [Gaeumannomyces tritici R3-111a-1]
MLTVLNLMALYGAFITTVRMAPVEIGDYLGNLRQQMCGERWALRQQGKELRVKLAAARLYHSHHLHHLHHHRTQAHHDVDAKTAEDRVYRRRSHRRSRRASSSMGSDGSTWRGCGASDNTNSTEAELLRLSMSEHTLALHQQAMRHGDVWTEKDLAGADARAADMEAYGDTGSFASWTAAYRRDFGHRFLWWRTKDDVRKVADKVSRLMMQRTEREVSHVRIMVKGIVEQGYSVGFGGGQRQGGRGGPEIRADEAPVLHHPTDDGMPSVRSHNGGGSSSSSDGEETQETSSTTMAAVNAGCSEVQRESSIVSEWRDRNSQARQATAPRSPPRVVQIRSSRDGRRTEYTVRSRGGGGPGGAVRVKEDE